MVSTDGSPEGIRGIATTKVYKTYYNVPAPVPGVDAGPHDLPRSLALEALEHEQGSHIGCPVRLTGWPAAFLERPRG
jgi:hypothetical protein